MPNQLWEENLSNRLALRTDTGPGIPENRYPELFEPFNRLGADKTEVEGTGIGLAICKELIQLMGGNIGVDSVVGAGSTFYIVLPIVQTQARLASAPKAKEDNLPEAPHDVKTVLNIEDNPTNLEIVRQALSNIPGIKLLAAHEAQLGIDIARNQKVDLILMDINLPGMSGLKALKVLQSMEKTRDIPVIALSANALQKDIDRGLEAGFMDYIAKPFDIVKLIETIRKFTQKHDHGQE